MVYVILHDYKIHNAEVLVREDCTVDEFIDVILGNRKYIKCLYCYNKIDQVRKLINIICHFNDIKKSFKQYNLYISFNN